MARPKKKVIKDCRISIRCTPEELDKAKAVAAKKGLSLANCIRKSLGLEQESYGVESDK